MKVLIGFLLSAAFLAGTVMAPAEEASWDDPEIRCKSYAQEDNVPPEELDAYLEECVAAELDIDLTVEELPAVDELASDKMVVQ